MRERLAPVNVERKILLLRSERMMLDADLAALYGVPTKQLVRAVKRNAARFPSDFMLQLTAEEHDALRYQSGTAKPGRGGRRTRAMLVGHADLARKLALLEKKYDAQFRVVFDAIRELMTPAPTSRRSIGFRPP